MVRRRKTSVNRLPPLPLAGEGRGEGLLAYCKKHLPNFMVPAHIAWLETLPRNPNGKIMKSELKKLFG